MAAPPPVAPKVVAPPSAAAEPPIEIGVTGDRPPREATKYVITGEEIRKIPGTNGDPLRAVETMPGVGRPPGIAGLLIVRGSGPRDTQVFIDGTWIPIAYHFGGITSVVPGDVLSRIDFYPGGFSAEFGRGMGGIVDLGLRSPRKDRPGGVLQFDLLDGRVLAEGPLSQKTRFLVAGRRSWIDAWLGPVLGSGLRSAGTSLQTAPVYWDWQAMVEHDVTERTTARVAFFGSDDRLALVMDAPNAQDPSAGGAIGGRTAFWRVQARSETRLLLETGPDVRWLNMVSYGVNRETFSLGANGVNSSLAIGNARSDVRAKLSRQATVVVGIDTMFVGYDVTVRFPPVAEDNPVGPFFGRPSREIVGKGSSVRPGAYAMVELTPFRGMKLIPGVRVDYTQENRRIDVDPRFAFRWDLVRGGTDSGRTTLKGALGYYRQPPLEQAVRPWGDATVRSNTSIHGSLGVEQVLGEHVELSVEGFYKHLKDLIVARPSETTTESGVKYQNTGSGRMFGVETLIRFKSPRFFGWIAYTLSKSERRDAPDRPLRTFDYDQTHILTALGSYDLGRGWSIGARFRYVTGLPYTPYVGGVVDLDAGAYEPIQSAPNSGRLAAFHKVDVRIDKTWKFTTARLTAYLDVQNVYNRQNAEGTTYSYDYSKVQVVPGLPILPILGLRGEL